MSIQREAFEKVIMLHKSAVYKADLDEYNWDDYPSVNHPFNELYEAFKEGWQAATDQAKPTGGGVPEGYVLVPIEMTEAMIKAFNRADKMYESGLGEAPGIHWRYILRATQQPKN